MDPRALRYLEAALDAVEQQFVGLLSQHELFAGKGAELSAVRVAGELRRVLAAVVELEGRRDVTYPELHCLTTLRARTVWLYRRLLQERLFARKLQLEERLRCLVSPEAYEVYLELQSCEVEEEADRAASDGELASRLLG